MSERVIIVGAGPGGLASAMRLAGSGADVRIIERLDRVGGRTSALQEEGFTFDLGPTFFLYPPVLEEIYRDAGYELMDEVPMVRLDPQYRLIFGAGGHLDATSDIQRMEAEIRRLSPGDGDGFRRYLADNRRKFDRFRPVLQSSFSGWKDVLTPQMMKMLPVLRPWNSLSDDLGRHFSDPRLQLAFTFQSKYLGMSPFQSPSLFSILSFLEYEYGVWHPRGGLNAITADMAEKAREMGVSIHLSEPVEEVLFSGRRAVGVRTTRGTYPADAVVMNADFARAMTRMVPNRNRRRWTDEKLEEKRFSCSTFMLYLGIEGRYEQPHHNIYITEEYERNLDEIERQHILSSDPSFYIQNASVTDPTLAPEGMSTLYVLVPVTHQHRNVDWTAERDRYRDLVVRQAAKAGFEDLDSRIRYEKVITPLEWDTSYEIHKGATFNLAHNLGQMLHLRPNNRFEDAEGFYLVGGGTHPGSGLPVIFESARISTRLLMADLGLEDRRFTRRSAAPLTRPAAVGVR